MYGATPKECAEKLAAAMVAKDDGPVFVPANITVAEFFGRYEDAVKDTMKRRSLEIHRDIAWSHLLPAFGASSSMD